MKKNDIGILGLGVMGQNLALNFANHSHSVSVYNRTDNGEEQITIDFMDGLAREKSIEGFFTIKEFVNSLETPRKILMMVQAGSAVDSVIEQLKGYLESGDILIDGGNSSFLDTQRRTKLLREENIEYIGCGISGGSSGALNGPSIMLGGSQNAWEKVESFLVPIAANFGEYKCCERVGENGAGHFVKMVHNGIEYAMMQMIAESFDILQRVLKLSYDDITAVYERWQIGELGGFLIKTTSEVMNLKVEDNKYLLDVILDSSNQKGTGKETSIASLLLGIPATTINEAVNARYMSNLLDLRMFYSTMQERTPIEDEYDVEKTIDMLEATLRCSFIIAYYQGISILLEASEEYNLDIDITKVVNVWRGGCIIESKIIKEIANTQCNDMNKLLAVPSFKNIFSEYKSLWKETVCIGVKNEIPIPVISSALSYFNALHTKRLSANLIQAQRDYFGYHGFERVDQDREKSFHIGE
jgi:6-phosphogluconate dehydrogenase